MSSISFCCLVSSRSSSPQRREFYNSRVLNKPYSVWTPPYTTAEPDITQYDLQPEDEFMVMASDGLFQDLNSQQVVEYVGEWLALQSADAERAAKSSRFRLSNPPADQKYCKNASTYLIKQSLLHASEHAVGRRRKENENLSWIMQLPIDSKRNYHDDISVVVVFFDHKAVHPTDAPVLSSPAGPPVPPTLARALSMHIKPPPPASQPTNLITSDTIPIKIAPLTDDLEEGQLRSNL